MKPARTQREEIGKMTVAALKGVRQAIEAFLDRSRTEMAVSWRVTLACINAELARRFPAGDAVAIHGSVMDQPL